MDLYNTVYTPLYLTGDASNPSLELFHLTGTDPARRAGRFERHQAQTLELPVFARGHLRQQGDPGTARHHVHQRAEAGGAEVAGRLAAVAAERSDPVGEAVAILEQHEVDGGARTKPVEVDRFGISFLGG